MKLNLGLCLLALTCLLMSAVIEGSKRGRKGRRGGGRGKNRGKIHENASRQTLQNEVTQIQAVELVPILEHPGLKNYHDHIFYFACYSNDLRIVRLGLEQGQEVRFGDPYDLNVLEAAALSGDLYLVEILICAALDIEDSSGALFMAASHGLIELFKFLVCNGYDFLKENSLKETPLSIILKTHSSEIYDFIYVQNVETCI